MSESTDTTVTEQSADETTAKQRRRKWLWLFLRVAGTAAGLSYVLFVADIATLVEVALSIPPYVPLAVICMFVAGIFVGAIRWKVVLFAYGAERSPSLLRLTYLYLVAFFYNTFLPGGLSGDVIRGLVSRESFGQAGITRSLTVVFVERVLGLAGLMIVVSSVLAVHPLPGLADTSYLGALGLAGAFVAVAAIALSRRLANVVPSFLGRFLAKLPPLERPAGLAAGLFLSLGTHFLTAVSGYLVLASVAPDVGLLDAMVVVPVATAAAFFPLTVGGAGAREAAFVFLCGAALSMDAESAAASSLVLFACQLTLAGLSGLLQLAVPLERPAH